MCFNYNITNVVCVRYIHIDTKTPNGYSIARLYMLFAAIYSSINILYQPWC